jgi:DMSO/TMAO reductase YedYZ heme-binding membrane subunit
VGSLLDLSNDAGLCAIGLLTLNILLGLLLSVKYNPVRRWPHHRINTVRLHNWIGYTALAVSFVHPVILLFDTSTKFGVMDLLWPLDAPKQPRLNTLGAIAFWLLLFVVTTSVVWQERWALNRRIWKRLHLLTYALFPLYAIHGLFADPALENHPIDPLDGEKVFVELCIACVLVAIGFRIRHKLRQPPPRVHRPKVVRARDWSQSRSKRHSP